MNFLQIFSIFILLIISNNSLIDCFFITNPIHWFRRQTTTESPQNQTVSTFSPIETTLSNISDQIPTLTVEQLSDPSINETLPIEPIDSLSTTEPSSTPDQTIDPLLPSKLGIPIKVDKFGLAPLPYPLNVNHPKIKLAKFNFDNFESDPVLHRRIGDLLKSTTQMPLIYEINDAIDKQFISNEESQTTTPSTQTTNTATLEGTTSPQMDIISDEYVEEENPEEDKEYHVTGPDSDSVTESVEDISPTPVYKLTTPAPDGSSERTTVRTTTPRLTYLHSDEFANLLNNMYYQKPQEVFQPMMDKFNTTLH